MYAVVIGLHGSLSGNIEGILQQGFRPGQALHNWLAPGIYVFMVDPVHGPKDAFDDAVAFAREKFGPDADIAVVMVRLRVDRLLDLQCREIAAALRLTEGAIRRRAAELCLRVEPNVDWVRPEAHLFISVFLLAVEALTGKPIDVICARFHGKETDTVPERPSRQYCIRHASAIIETMRVSEASDIAAAADEPAARVPTNLMLQAARQVSTLIAQLPLVQFADLIFKHAESTSHTWSGQSRFAKASPRIAIVGHGVTPAVAEVERACRAVRSSAKFALRAITPCDNCGPEESRGIDEVISQADGLVVIWEQQDLALASLLSRARARNLPIVVFVSSKAKLPCEILSMQNVTVIELHADEDRRGEQLAILLPAFVRDDWAGDSARLRLELMHAARDREHSGYNSKISRYSALKMIMEQDEFDNIAQLSLREPGESGTPESPLRGLSLVDIEKSAEELRHRLQVTTDAISRTDLLRALGSPRIRYLADIASGLYLPEGTLKGGSLVVLKKGEPLVRYRFTLAHEIAHEIINQSRDRPAGDVEDLCDSFAAELLMTSRLMDKFELECSWLEQWLDAPAHFQVSIETFARHLWSQKRKLIAASTLRASKSPLPSVARELARKARVMGYNGDRGTLACGAPYVIRHFRSGKGRSGFEAIADFASIPLPKN